MTEQRVEGPAAGERLAALMAIVALIAAILLAALKAAKNWDSLLVTLIGVLVLVTSGWYAVSRRGTARFVAASAALVGVALLITGFILADLDATMIILFCLLSAVSVVAARYALRRNEAALQRVAAWRSPVPPAQHPVLIMNLRSGGGKAEKYHLVEECRRRGIEPVVLGQGDDLLQLADDAVTRGADVIGMAGGDGSQALVATVAVHRGVPHVVIPAGTRITSPSTWGSTATTSWGPSPRSPMASSDKSTSLKSTGGSSSTTRHSGCTPRSSNLLSTATPNARQPWPCFPTCWGPVRSPWI